MEIQLPAGRNKRLHDLVVLKMFFAFFFENPKKHDFLRFLRCCTRFVEHWLVLRWGPLLLQDELELTESNNAIRMFTGSSQIAVCTRAVNMWPKNQMLSTRQNYFGEFIS